MSAPTQWRKSTFSGGQGPDCVEVARDAHAVHIRESDQPGTILTSTTTRLAAFIVSVKAGDLDHLTG
ncbi:DUF397 domain-containing protein [Streptomyces rapamycinicus]|uniref:DUF397 domain-containing protein n=2 Tax=Streptomyces rapamycinicus TaxID=1226757 RepID=A0A3L8RHP4_STRRN|nr:DUF397 domain-containing protein [Streptomyces rapamycinicus]MBB4785337.1 hypothetical protein [Streptomyces rapamycinicus]RLV79194.1 hypothetical protein D3C57_112455 [Streptomyces rapamycinicus NRRL 5491]UTO68155.1 DUF397 domain-containing protein [Streptomyces rapamycinicus]UTP37352.1 DUF397 domain-containing protein [Streptomyces rapamycinicus NRRL 5491]